MAANTDPIFTLIPVIGKKSISTANTNRDGTGTLETVLTGALNGSRVNRITIQAIVTTTAGMVRLYIGDDSQSPLIHLWKEIPISAITVGANTPAFSFIVPLLGENALVLPYGYTLRASTHNAESFNIIAEGGNF